MYNLIIASSLTALSVLACSAKDKAVNNSTDSKTEIASSMKEAENKTNTPATPKAAGPGESTTQNTQKMAGIVYFKEGESTFLKEQQMSFTFKKMLEDSRCPREVNCVWEGVATAEVELMGSYTRPITVKLSTLNNPQKGYNDHAIFNGYQYTLVQADPYPTSARGFKANAGVYVIGIRMDKVAENRIEPNVR